MALTYADIFNQQQSRGQQNQAAGNVGSASVVTAAPKQPSATVTVTSSGSSNVTGGTGNADVKRTVTVNDETYDIPEGEQFTVSPNYAEPTYDISTSGTNLDLAQAATDSNYLSNVGLTGQTVGDARIGMAADNTMGLSNIGPGGIQTEQALSQTNVNMGSGAGTSPEFDPYAEGQSGYVYIPEAHNIQTTDAQTLNAYLTIPEYSVEATDVPLGTPLLQALSPPAGSEIVVNPATGQATYTAPNYEASMSGAPITQAMAVQAMAQTPAIYDPGTLQQPVSGTTDSFLGPIENVQPVTPVAQLYNMSAPGYGQYVPLYPNMPTYQTYQDQLNNIANQRGYLQNLYPWMGSLNQQWQLNPFQFSLLNPFLQLLGYRNGQE